MNAREILEHVRDTLTVQRVFGDPIERDGLLVVPVASVTGGGGSGEGQPAEGAKTGSGSGGGWGGSARGWASSSSATGRSAGSRRSTSPA
jgi:uncharacterized spore protein YtfJ